MFIYRRTIFPYTLYHICYRNSKHFFLPGNNSDLILICSNKTGNKNTLSSLTTAEGKSDPCGRLQNRQDNGRYCQLQCFIRKMYLMITLIQNVKQKQIFRYRLKLYKHEYCDQNDINSVQRLLAKNADLTIFICLANTKNIFNSSNDFKRQQLNIT